LLLRAVAIGKRRDTLKDTTLARYTPNPRKFACPP
jgi:hypothetical protein